MPDIRHQLIIAAPPEKVFHAVTSQEGLSAWWTPGATASPELNSVARFPFGPDYYKEMKIAELKPPELVKWICLKGDQEWIGTTLSFRLEPGNEGSLLRAHPEMRGQAEQLESGENLTLLIFHHENWKDYTPMYAECNFTWGRFLWSLKLLCETGKGLPWPDQHRV
jgi:uncharacterized protein YndB with AHSA1/START domain